MATRVVNKYNDCWDVDITRRSIFGNPVVIGKHGTRKEVIEKFREWIEQPAQRNLVDVARRKLKGRVLGCVCKPLPCHGDVWIEILDATP